MSDIFDKKFEPAGPSIFENYNTERQRPLHERIEYADKELNDFMGSQYVSNLLDTSIDRDSETAKIETVFNLSKKYGMSPEEVFKQYGSITRHYFGDDNPVSNKQAIDDMRTTGELMIQVDELEKLKMRMRNNPESEEEIQGRIDFLKAQMPPEDLIKRNLPVAIAKEFTQNVPKWLEVAKKTTPYNALKDHKLFVDRFESEKGRKPTTAEQWMVAAIKYIAKSGMTGDVGDLAKIYVPEWISMFGGQAGMIAGAWKVYTDWESGSLYGTLTSIEGPNEEKLDKDTAAAIATVFGGIKSAAEVWSDVVVLKGIPGFDSVFERGFSYVSKKVFPKAIISKTFSSMLARGTTITFDEVGTEIFQEVTDAVGVNLGISLEKEREFLFESGKVTPEELLQSTGEIIIKTALATAPLAVLGAGWAGVNTAMTESAVSKAEIEQVIKDAFNGVNKNDFVTADIVEKIKADPRMDKYSDKGIERIASKTIIENELSVELAKAPTETIGEWEAAIEELMLIDFKRTKPDFDESSTQFDNLFEQYKEDNIDNYIAPLKMDDASLREIYNKNHVDKNIKTDVQAVPIVDEEGKPVLDENDDQAFRYEEVEVPGIENITFEEFKDQRRRLNAYINNWVHTPEGKKYLANMQPSVDKIEQLMTEEMPGKTKEILTRSVGKIQSLVTNAQDGGKIATMADFKVQTQVQINQLNNRISELEALGRENRTNKESLAQINEKIRELIRTRYDITSTYGEINHILETVSRGIFNENRILRNLESIHDRLVGRIEEYNDPIFQDFLAGKVTVKQAFENIKESIIESAELAHDEELLELLKMTEKDIFDSDIALSEALYEIESSNLKERERLTTELNKALPNLDKATTSMLIDLLQFRANAEEQSLKEFTDKWFQTDLFDGSLELNKTANAAVFTDKLKKMKLGFKEDTDLNIVLHEFGHIFQHTLSDSDKNTFNSWATNETLLRLERLKDSFIDDANKKERIRKLEIIIDDLFNDKVTKDVTYEINETFAHSFQEYAINSRSEKSYMNIIFNKFADFLRNLVYRKGAPKTWMEGRLNDEMIQLLDRQFERDFTSYDQKAIIAGDLNYAIENSLTGTFENAKIVQQTSDRKRMIIAKMQKALSNYLKLNGEKLMESITYPVESTVSDPVKYKIESIQAAIEEVNKAVSEVDIANARGFIDYILLEQGNDGYDGKTSLSKRIKEINKNIEREGPDNNLLTNPAGIPYEINYQYSSERVAQKLMNTLKITYDENATAIKPKLSLADLIDLKTEVDLLRFLGKLELAEVKKENIITDEIRKSEFLSSQKSITKLSKKERSKLSAIDFDTMSSHDWAKKLFGDNGIEMFTTEKNTADNNARLEKNRRTKEVIDKIGGKEKDLAMAMFEEIDHEGQKYTVQQLMYYFLNRHDHDAWIDLKNGNGIPLSLLGEFGIETAGVDEILTEKQKEIALTLREDLEKAWNRTAGTFEAVEGKRLGKVFQYLPKPPRDLLYKSLEEEIIVTMFRGTDYQAAAVNKSMTFERRIATEENAVAIQDGLWDIWQNYIHKQEHYIAHARWVQQAKRFMADPTVKNTIAENYNPAWVQGIDKYITDTANPTALHGATGTDELMRNLRHNIAVSALGGRMGIVLRQIPSVMMYLSEVGIQEFSSAIVEYTSNIYFENGKMKNHVIDMITEVDPTSIDTKTGYDMLHYKHTKSKAKEAFRTAQDVSMAGIWWMDRNIKAIGWLSIVNKNQNVIGKENAIKKARDYTVLYQPSGDKTTLPGMYRHSDIMNMALMFTQQPVKIFNYTRNNVYPNLKNKDGNKMAGIYGLMAVMTMNTAIWALTQKRLPEDPEDWFQAVSIGSIGTIPWLGKSIQDGLTGRQSFQRSLIGQPVDSVFELLNISEWSEALNDPEKLTRKVKSINKGIGITTGTPTEFINDLIDFIMKGKLIHVILGGEKGEKK